MLWRFIARLIATTPWLVSWLIKSAQTRPYYHLTGYMDRWWLLPGAAANDSKSEYRSPWWLRRFPISIRLHHIKRPDNDRHLHDHPCGFRSIILKGWYYEARSYWDFDDVAVCQARPGACRLRQQGTTHFAKATTYHSIVAVPAEGVWTLFIMYQTPGPSWNRWGFLVDGKKVPWREYLKEKENE